MLSKVKFVHGKNDIAIGIVLVFIFFVQRPFIQSYIYVLLMISVFLYFGSSNKQAKKTEAVAAKSVSTEIA